MVCLHDSVYGGRSGWSGWGRLALILYAFFSCSDIQQVRAFLTANKLSSIRSCETHKFRSLFQLKFSGSWLPDEILATGPPSADHDSDEAAWRLEIESKSLDLMATLISYKMEDSSENECDPRHLSAMNPQDSASTAIFQDKFVDLSCTPTGEKRLEDLFYHSSVQESEDHEVLGAIASLHSLLVLGMNFGLSGTPEQYEKWMSHLAEPGDDDQLWRDYKEWDAASTRRLKFRNERSAGIQLLAQLKRKQSPQGAFDLLVSLGVWTKHEDLALLRSGFPITFSKGEIRAARELLVSFNYVLYIHICFLKRASDQTISKYRNIRATTRTVFLESEKTYGV
jgi:hypothetical protein